MGKVKQSWFLIIICLSLLGLTQLPYILAFWSSPPNYVFGGFLINPLDGNSYIAKMYEGWRGDWLFTLPYTVQVGHGTFIYFFYILLGHLARIFHVPLIFTYHLIRAMGCVGLVLALSGLIKVVFNDTWSYRFALLMACFGSGMGWLAMPSGYITSDFWVAEAYPFLSSLVNPHFCLATALMLWIMRIVIENQPPKTIWKYFWIVMASFMLGLLAPFAFVIVVILIFVLISINIFFALREKQAILSGGVHSYLGLLSCVIIGGAPILYYEIYVFNTDPILRGWQAQNITLSPPFWDLLLSFSPLFILAIFGAIIAARQKMRTWYSVVAWLVIGIIFVYLPWSLQRRFLFGLFIPIALLATLAMQYLNEKFNLKGFRLIIFGTFFIATFTTNLLLEITTIYGIKTKDPLLFLTRSEDHALTWIEGNTPSNALVLASPQMGLFIPAHTGRRVIYGHPFETVDAADRKNEVTTFYSGFGSENIQDQQSEFLEENQIHYIFWGPRERLLNTEQTGQIPLKDITPVFQDDDVIIYQVVH